MLEIWHNMGFIRWPIGFSALMVLGLTTYSTAQLYRPGAWADLKAKVFVDGILFWGAFSIIAGMLGSLIGIILAFGYVERSGSVDPTLVAGGLKVALLSTAAGLLIMALASLIWFGLQFRWRTLQAREAQAG